MVKMIQNFNTSYPMVYAGAFLGVIDANLLENNA